MEQLAELEKSLKKQSKLLDNITEVPKNIRDNQQQTYAQLEKKSLSSPSLHKRRKKFRYTSGIATVALALGVVVFCSGFVSPVMAEKLSQIPVVGSIFERSNDPGLQAASHLGLVQDTNGQDTHEGVTVRASDVIYDGIRLSLGLQREGRSFEGSFQGVQLDADGHPLENGKGSVVWNPEDTTGQGSITKVLIDGIPLNPSESEPDAFKRSIGYTVGTGPDQDSMILTFANNNAVDNGVALPDEFMMSLTMEITGINKPFQIDIPVKKDTSHTSVYTPGLTKLHDHLALTVNKVTVSPATTLIQITAQNEGTIPDAYLNDQKTPALDHEFYDDQGNELEFVGAQGWVDHDSSPTHYKQVQDYLNGPISENAKYLVVKTLKYKVDANGNSVVDKQGDFVKENIPELEFKIPLQK
ncbi:DUF4179 domain-containing protein [Paenibacillus sp. ISL-20]|uniref:DUF4179 domain-containing protein n=1 Tax=Paenibacillus sp. ISL-20 TaxID=2819163 RepID=UPI001BEA637C|nr:DUF4179 domain-containing protein [Paenibacillus sp. ISL-20]MBT2764884.1 DUF4179 domain-containing protein [Paenibacillus sp. ISL-20]